MNCNRCGFPITPEFPAMLKTDDLHAGGGTCIRAQRTEIKRLREAAQRFSQAHRYVSGEDSDAHVDPQDWAEFDAAFKVRHET